MRQKETLLILLLLLALIPYFILCFYALPYADDFCYAWTSGEHISFAHRFLRQYMSWSGRYSAHVLLCNHPFVDGNLLAYQTADLISLCVTALIICIFIRRIISSLTTTLIVSSAILLFYLCYIPQLSEGVYWYTGVCNYLLSNDCLLLHIAILILSVESKGIIKAMYYLVAALLLIAAIGFTEEGAALIPSYYLLTGIIMYQKGYRSKDIYPVAVFFVIAFLSSAALAFAPGNYTRSHSHQFHEQYQILHSVLYASLQTARFIAIWLCTLPALALSAVVIAKADSVDDQPYYHVPHWLILLLLLFSVFMGGFIPYFSTGILGQHRTINYVFFYFIFLWTWWLITVSKRYGLYEKPTLRFIRQNMFAILAISIIVMACTGNGENILRDIRAHSFTTYRNEFIQRQQNIIQHPDMPIAPLESVPLSFEIVDARTDTTWWVNKCMKYFYRDKKDKPN